MRSTQPKRKSKISNEIQSKTTSNNSDSISEIDTIEPAFSQDTGLSFSNLLSRIKSKNHQLDRKPANRYAQERLHLKGIQDDISSINQSIQNLHEMQARLSMKRNLVSHSEDKN